ncbi:MAG: hypothetical protein LIP11_08285 [Clostridiales bacterium]|nr:hypothetical protein [Clostridiales bacterium]
MHFLDFEPMDEGDMVEYLGEMERMDKRIQEMLREEYSKLESFEECIRRRSFRNGVSELGTGSQSHSTKTDTVYNILCSVQSDMDRQGREIAQQILKITEGQEKLNYVRFCIRSLPQEQEELILHVYVKGEGQVAYAKEKYFSKATASRRTRAAMGNLLELYNGRFASNRGTDRERMD